jgi:hypothetical protein
VAFECRPHALDRERRVNGRRYGVAIENRDLRHAAEVKALECSPMSRNGERHPPRPSITLLTETGSDTEAAAVVAAVEQFLADTAPAPAPPSPAQSRWQRAALLEGVTRAQLLAWGSDSG